MGGTDAKSSHGGGGGLVWVFGAGAWFAPQKILGVEGCKEEDYLIFKILREGLLPNRKYARKGSVVDATSLEKETKEKEKPWER